MKLNDFMSNFDPTPSPSDYAFKGSVFGHLKQHAFVQDNKKAILYEPEDDSFLLRVSRKVPVGHGYISDQPITQVDDADLVPVVVLMPFGEDEPIILDADVLDELIADLIATRQQL